MEWFSQIGDQLWRGWLYLTTGRVMATVLGIGFALLAVTLLIASRTKWGQAKPLTKCVVVSILLHVWLLMYALGIRNVLPQGSPDGVDQNISLSFEASQETLIATETLAQQAFTPAAEETEIDPLQTRPWEKPIPLADLPKPPELDSMKFGSDLAAPSLLPKLEPTPMPALPPDEVLADLSKPETTTTEGLSYDSSAELATDASDMTAVLPPSMPALETIGTQSPSPATPLQTVSSQTSRVLPPEAQLPENPRLPDEYRLRQAPNRLQLAAAYGADADSEAAVEAGLKWLASTQSSDGSWIAAQFGAGTETRALGEDRSATGDQADTGVTGLALLAFLSAGHTHLEGDYQPTVLAGIQYLLRSQMSSGDMSGDKLVGNELNVLYSRMYCHSIASLALAEAYAMTLDPRIRGALLKAAQYSTDAQDKRGGGWRYRPSDQGGDLSQFGWQAMSLKSVERSGIRLPIETKPLMQRFLNSCQAGTNGGLATYRPGEGRPSDTMTAEALACRLLLDYPLALDAQHEAISLIMRNRPGKGEDNVYFWYYATLALFQLQDENWRDWNQAMKSRLLSTQVPVYGDQPGSWNPDALWGGYGGRVYSTAMGCLCLEVYYRYLPMYQRSNLARTPAESNYSR